MFECRLRSHPSVRWEDVGIMGNNDDDIAVAMGDDEVFFATESNNNNKGPQQNFSKQIEVIIQDPFL